MRASALVPIESGVGVSLSGTRHGTRHPSFVLRVHGSSPVYHRGLFLGELVRRPTSVRRSLHPRHQLHRAGITDRDDQR